MDSIRKQHLLQTEAGLFCFFRFFLLQDMNDLQTVAFESSAYDPVTDGNDSKEELKEVEIKKETGYREQDFTEAAPGLNTP